MLFYFWLHSITLFCTETSSGFLISSMNSKSVLADILELLKSHLHERHKKSCQVSDALQKTGGSDDSSEGGSLLNSPKIESITDLNQSLKLNERSPLLDAALSIMGYQVPQICDATTGFLIDTLTSILQSTITCKMLSKSSCNAVQKSQNEANTSHCIFDIMGPNKEKNWLADVGVYRQLLSSKQQFLQIGTVISANDFFKIVKACEAILGNLQAYGSHSKLLIDKLLRVATSISSFQGQFPLSCRVYKKVAKEKSSLVDFFNLYAKEEDIIDVKFDKSTRLLAWRFQPLLLKQDMSNLLFEAVQRPLLHVKNELQHRYAWNSMVISLAAAPEIFSEARRLLHKWFLQTGADRVLEVQIELVSAILDVLSRPSSWGIPLDADLKFPSSYAFFCQRLQSLLTVLMGPLSYGNLLTILNILEEMQSWEEFNSTDIQSFSSNKKPCKTSLLVDHNSAWALLLDFPTWFHFASILLFQQDTVEFSEAQPGTESHDSKLVQSKNVTGKVDKVRASSFDSFYNAAKYLAWVLSPLEASHRDLVVRSLVETAKSWKPWRSKLICSEKRTRVEETCSQFNSLGWEGEIKVNRKRSVSSLASEKSGMDVRHKKAKVEWVHEDPAQNYLHEKDTGDNSLEKSPQAVMMWLADFSHSCSELCSQPVMSDLLHMNASIYRGTRNCEGWSESQAVRTERMSGGLSQKAGADAWVTHYAFLRRIPLGLFLANVHLLNEYACYLLLHFVAAEEGSVLTPDSAVGTYHDIPKNQCANLQVGHASTSLYPRNSVEMNMCTEEPAHRTEGFRESTLSDCQGERKTNWVRVTTFILGFFDMLDFNYHVFENAESCQIFWSEVKEKTSKFLVTCIKMLLESRDLHELRLLIDLRRRLVEQTHHGETLCDKGTLCQDILPALDSQISLLQTSR